MERDRELVEVEVETKRKKARAEDAHRKSNQQFAPTSPFSRLSAPTLPPSFCTEE